MIKFKIKSLLVSTVILPLLAISSTSNYSHDYSNKQINSYKAWVSKMKTLNRGPFKRLRWFCNDGRILGPKGEGVCGDVGGLTYAEWSDNSKILRDNGFYIGNILSASARTTKPIGKTTDERIQNALLKSATKIAKNPSPTGELTAILIEQFLTEIDNGWILRKAQFYRGAFQVEDDEIVGNFILNMLVNDQDRINNDYLLIIESLKNLPSSYRGDTKLIEEIRNDAISLQNSYASFMPLRNKIHGKLAADDAKRLRDYAEQHKDFKRHNEIVDLADKIDRVFRTDTVDSIIQALDIDDNDDYKSIKSSWKKAQSGDKKLIVIGKLAKILRNEINIKDKYRLDKMKQIIQLEQNTFIIGRSLINDGLLKTKSRQELLELANALAQVLYANGFLTPEEQSQSEKWITNLSKKQKVNYKTYQEYLKNIKRIPIWSERRQQFFFGPQIARFSLIEPLAHEYIPSKLRSSPLLIYTHILKILDNDSAKLSGVSHNFFKKDVSSGFRVLNSGSGKGVLLTPEMLAKQTDKPTDVILVVPETLSDLPAVAGILTAFEGNQLSHVQLLARNLGVPNIVVNQELISNLEPYYGQYVELLASEGGVVKISKASPDIDQPQKITQSIIEVDINKLDLKKTKALSLSEIGVEDSGVSIGPKAAKVAELSHKFPNKVSAGVAIPFGAFNQLLNEKKHPSGISMFSWIKKEYKYMETLSGKELEKYRSHMLKNLRQWFKTVKLNPEFIADLKAKMDKEFGQDGTYGVFVRSDTNVEDLSGFTGAGLNLTVSNVVGFENVIKALRDVWASPFTERAFGWRQARMNHPEHVYTAILLHKSVDSDKSGVLVTKDIFSGKDGKLSVVINEGVSGGVDGLSAQSMIIDRESANTTLISSATAPYRRKLNSNGGVLNLKAMGTTNLLTPSNIGDLIDFSDNVGVWFGDSKNATADVEFGFKNNKFILFQIRPLVDSKIGKTDEKLKYLDQKLIKNYKNTIKLTEKPMA